MVIPTALASVLCCLLLVCPPLLWTRQRALIFALKSYRCKRSRLREVRALRCPAGRFAQGGVRRASLLLLVPWLAVCTAAGTICSNEPTACNGTYSGTELNFNNVGYLVNNLSGSLPTQLGALTALTIMTLNGNSLSGSLPTQLGALTALSRM